MTTGFRLTLLCLVMLCLLLSLTQPAEFDHPLRARWSAAISGLQRYIDCGQYGSTRLGESWSTGCDRGLGELPVRRQRRQLQNQHPRAPFAARILAQTTNFQNSGVSQQPLASHSEPTQYSCAY